MSDQIQSAHLGTAILTEKEREAFLADIRVGVMSIARAKLAPLSVPLCYSYEPGGELRTVIEEDSFKTKLLKRTGRFSFCVHNETPPFKYVTVEGPATIEPADPVRDLAPILAPYHRDMKPAELVESVLSWSFVQLRAGR